MTGVAQRGFGVLLLAAACSNILGIQDNNTQVECISNANCPPNFSCQVDRCVCAVNCGSGGESGEVGLGGGAGVVAGGPGATSGDAGRSAAGTRGEAGDESSGGESGTAPSSSGGRAGSGGGPQGGAGGMTFVPGGMAGVAEGGEAGTVSTCDPLHTECPDVCGELELSNGCPTCLSDEVCEVPPSCLGMTQTCTQAADSCCLSLPVPGGDFLRSCDLTCQVYCRSVETPDFPATVAPFSLDAFEVTVGRFRAFVDQFPSSRPAAGAGKNPNGKDGKGWDADWDMQLLPGRDEFRADLASRDCPGAATWTADETSFDSRPMTCVTWFEAAAFCIWDHGRLPTEAEWNFAAAGGDEQRVFPWSSPRDDETIDDTYAVYSADSSNPRTGPEMVGTRPSGRGRWGQYDLGGNVTEWVWDALFDCYTAQTCDNCGSVVGSEDRVARGGGFSFGSGRLLLDSRDRSPAVAPHDYFGFRCARDR